MPKLVSFGNYCKTNERLITRREETMVIIRNMPIHRSIKGWFAFKNYSIIGTHGVVLVPEKYENYIQVYTVNFLY